MARETAQERLCRMTQIEIPLWDEGLAAGGVDEAGRGPLAGSVVAACVVMPREPLLLGVNDSKKLSEKKREELFEQIMETAIRVGVGEASVQEIDALNIKNAARLAMVRAIQIAAPEWVLVDAERDLDILMPQQGIVHGDAVSYLIACASIIAKVTRDRQMLALDEEYPGYGFSKHKGYGTKEHMEAIRNLGPTPAHRPLFIRSALSKKP